MAKVKYTDKDISKGDSFTGIEGEYDGVKFNSQFYAGDTRSKPIQVQAHKVRLYGDALKYAQKNGKPIPDPD